MRRGREGLLSAGIGLVHARAVDRRLFSVSGNGWNQRELSTTTRSWLAAMSKIRLLISDLERMLDDAVADLLAAHELRVALRFSAEQVAEDLAALAWRQEWCGAGSGDDAQREALRLDEAELHHRTTEIDLRIATLRPLQRQVTELLERANQASTFQEGIATEIVR